MDYAKLEELCRRLDVKFSKDEPLAQYTTMKIGGNCDILVCPDSEEDIAEIAKLCRIENIPFFVLGRGSNVLVSDKGYRGCIIYTCGSAAHITVDGTSITASAGTSLTAVCKAALENGLTGIEFAYGIPGSVGGALFMNAGAYGGEMKDVVASCHYIDENGKLCTMSAEDMDLSYRHSTFSGRNCIITSVTIKLQNGNKNEIKEKMQELMSRRRDKQPLEYPSCGSTFKRPVGYFAAALIEECGLKGFTIGGAQVSEKHSGFVINRDNASCSDVMAVVKEVKRIVFEEKGVELECEMLILGE